MILDGNFKKIFSDFLYNVEQKFSELKIPKSSTIVVGLSGGVDSSVTLAILKELGFNTIGLTMKIWNPKYSYIYENSKGKVHGCFGPEEIEDIKDADKVCKILKTPFFVIDLTKEYEQIVLEYFKNEYLEGKTPNPCVICNWKMKFEFLLNKAISSNIPFDYFATGHYVRKVIYNNIYTLARAQYIQKDQTYYLSYLNSDHIQRSVFPLGYILNKDFTRQIAHFYKLPTHNKPDSQNFISGKYIEIFKNQSIRNGLILDKNGKVLGKHEGIHLYTIGQRKGLNIPHYKPLYVINIDKENNTIIVGEKEDLYQKKLIAKDVNWIILEELEKFSKENIITAKIRYTHEPAACKIKKIDTNSLYVEFYEPQLAITPGQIIAFYKDDILIGAATIYKVIID